MIELVVPPLRGINVSVGAIMRLHFGVGWPWCEDSTDDCKSENRNIIIRSSVPNPNILGKRMSASFGNCDQISTRMIAAIAHVHCDWPGFALSPALPLFSSSLNLNIC